MREGQHLCRDVELTKSGGIEDHIHVVSGVSPDVSIDSMINKVKKESAKAVRRKYPGRRGFKWQIGYACFSINPFDMENLINYVKNQKEHHRNSTHIGSREPHLFSS